MERDPQLVLGVMSGTSCDGLDLALCLFSELNGRWHFEVLQAVTLPYDHALRQQLSSAHTLGAAELIRFDRAFGRYIGDQVKVFLGDDAGRVSLISSHGHTVFHSPKEGYSFQIGHGAAIAAATGIDTICDLRSTDVALGGEGAPLVPLGDALLFPEADICLNLGGFANLSYDDAGRRVAFDVCPVNLPINALCARLGLAFDRDGDIARSHQPDSRLLSSLERIYGQERPSLSREWIESHLDPLIDSSELSAEVLIATITEHAARKLAATLDTLPGRTVLCTGGGAFNAFLIERIGALTQNQIMVPAREVVEFKEAIIWAFLGHLAYNKRVNVLSSYTGAAHDSVAGGLYRGTY